MAERQCIPADLAELAPGPELAAVLAGVDVSRLSGFDCVEVLKARYRQLNHDRARLLDAMAEVGVCGIGPDDEVPRVSAPDEFAADEVRAALVWTRRAADAQFTLAWELRTRLPAALAAMDAGYLDEPRARILVEWTADLTVEQARAVGAELLPRVGELTTGRLIEAIKKLAIAIDPHWARRRYEQAVADRKVVGSRNPDGSANLSGVNLPLGRVAGASSHIEALAERAKRAGHTDPVDQVRADLYLGMLDGAYAGLDDQAVVERLLGGAALSGGDSLKDDQEPAGGSAASAGCVAADSASRVTRPDPAYADRSSDLAGIAPVSGRAPNRTAPPTQLSLTRGVELRVRLSTLLGRDEYPGELAGWGPVHADLARDTAAAMTSGQWRYAITDETGQPEHTGLLRSRPRDARPPRPGGTVEVQVPARLLTDLAEGLDNALTVQPPGALPGGWAAVIAELTRHRNDKRSMPSRFASDANRRTPGAALRRHLQIRDRRCVGPGCRAPARSGDIDHTLAHVEGGQTVEDNLGITCRHDHRLKHEGGWQLHQPEPGRFLWISRLGHVYTVLPPALIEALPDPVPGYRRVARCSQAIDEEGSDEPILQALPPPEPAAVEPPAVEPPAPARVPHLDDSPPF